MKKICPWSKKEENLLLRESEHYKGVPVLTVQYYALIMHTPTVPQWLHTYVLHEGHDCMKHHLDIHRVFLTLYSTEQYVEQLVLE